MKKGSKMQNNIFSPEIIGRMELYAHKHICNDAAKPVHITVGNEIDGFGWYITLDDNDEPEITATDCWSKFYCEDSDLTDISYEYHDNKNDTSFRIKRASLSNAYKYRDKFLTKQGDSNDK